MIRPKKLLLLLVLGLVVGLAVWSVNREREPNYQGKTITEWLAEREALWIKPVPPALVGVEYQRKYLATYYAVNHIGTNVLPWIIKGIDHSRPKVMEKAERMLAPAAYRLRIGAAYRKLISLDQRTVRAVEALNCLSNRVCTPELVAVTTKRYLADERFRLERIHSEETAAFHRYIDFLRGDDLPSRSYIVIWLSPTNGLTLDTNILVKGLVNPDPLVRSRATEALQIVAPELLTTSVPARPASPP